MIQENNNSNKLSFQSETNFKFLVNERQHGWLLNLREKVRIAWLILIKVDEERMHTSKK